MSKQPDLFSQPASNYSFETSLPSYRDNQAIKQKQAALILQHIKAGANNLLQLAEITGLPQSTVSGRCNDLIEEEKVMYSEVIVYKNRKRKKIIAL